MEQLELFPELFKREETGINHTYELKLRLGNLTKSQLNKFQDLIDYAENEGVIIWENRWEND